MHEKVVVSCALLRQYASGTYLLPRILQIMDSNCMHTQRTRYIGGHPSIFQDYCQMALMSHTM